MRTDELVAPARSSLPVTAVRTRVLAVTMDPEEICKRGIDVTGWFLVVEVEVDDVVGLGYTWGMAEADVRSTREFVEGLAKRLIGRDSRHIRALWHEHWQAISIVGQAGAGLGAVAAIDTALWDALGKRAGLPVHRMLGTMQVELTSYLTGGGLSLGPERLAEEGLGVLAAGHRAYKIQLCADWRRDLQRVAALRDAVGDRLEIMGDAHQELDRNSAAIVGRELADMGVTWFEDPLPIADLDGYARLRGSLDLRVIHGENAVARFGIRDIVRAGAADVVMIDLMHCGGITEFMNAAAYCAAEHVQVSSHAFYAPSRHVLAACERPSYVEYIDTWDDIFLGAPPPVDGVVTVSEEPGLGIELSPDAVARFTVEVR